MRHISITLLSLFMLSTSLQAHDELAPYIYYYSDVLNAFVIERADGTDSRMIAQGLTNPIIDRISGPSWSPDGRWLAWVATALADYGTSTASPGYAISVDNQNRVELLDSFSGIFDMRWSPERNLLFVSGYTLPCSIYCGVVTHWLVDVERETVLASFSIRLAAMGAGSTPFEWSFDHERVIFYAVEDTYVVQYYQIEMGFDGTVIKQHITQEAWEAVFSPVSYDLQPYEVPLDSPSGHYTGHGYDRELMDTETGNPIPLPIHSDGVGKAPIAARWHPSEKWVLLGYNQCVTESTCIGGVSILGINSLINRELGSCGFGVGCVDWLPEQVDIRKLPPGSPESVQPAPIRYDYFNDTVDPEFSPGTDEPYVLACDVTNNTYSLVQDKTTRATVFVLKNAAECPSSDMVGIFPFALSPDGRWYAADTGIGLNERTALFDAATGERLATLNVDGWELAFSPDGKRLTTRTTNARLIWDVEQVLSITANPQLNMRSD
jgi:hypothetical protein